MKPTGKTELLQKERQPPFQICASLRLHSDTHSPPFTSPDLKMRSFSLLALAAPLVAAIDFASPAANATLFKGESFSLSWNTVDTDPSEFSLYLVNFVNWPPYYAPLAYNVETSSGEIEVKLPCNIDNSEGYQL